MLDHFSQQLQAPPSPPTTLLYLSTCPPFTRSNTTSFLPSFITFMGIPWPSLHLHVKSSPCPPPFHHHLLVLPHFFILTTIFTHFLAMWSHIHSCILDTFTSLFTTMLHFLHQLLFFYHLPTSPPSPTQPVTNPFLTSDAWSLYTCITKIVFYMSIEMFKISVKSSFFFVIGGTQYQSKCSPCHFGVKIEEISNQSKISD